MNTSIALLRGINVGGRNILPMKELVALLESLGYTQIRTYIQSGNIVFQSAKKADAEDVALIGQKIFDEKGFKPRVLVIDESELQAAIAANPYPTDDGKALHFYFLEEQPQAPNLERLQSLQVEGEEFELGQKVFYLFAPGGIGRSKLAAGVEKALGVSTTARNWNTVKKLVHLLEKSSVAGDSLAECSPVS